MLRWTCAWVLVATVIGCRADGDPGDADGADGGGGSGGAASTATGGTSSGGTNAGGESSVGGGSSVGGAAPESCDPYAPRDPAPQVVVAPEGYESRVIEFMSGAEASIDVMMYQFTRQSIADALIAAHQRGVAVRVLLDGLQEANETVRADLTAAGIDVRNAPSAFDHAHAKVTIVDGASAMIASANYNSFSMSSERNYAVIDTAADDVADARAIFEADWDGAPLDLTCTRLVVSPENARDRLVQLIWGATEQLDLAVMYVSDATVRQAIAARAEDGVVVRVLLADPDWIDNNATTATQLQAAGAEVRFLTEYGLHAKLVIADGTAFIGSENFSPTSLDQNREVGVFVTEPEATAVVASTFESDWAVGIVP